LGPGREEDGGGAGITGAAGVTGAGVGVFRLFWLMPALPIITKQPVMNSNRLIFNTILIWMIFLVG